MVLKLDSSVLTPATQLSQQNPGYDSDEERNGDKAPYHMQKFSGDEKPTHKWRNRLIIAGVFIVIGMLLASQIGLGKEREETGLRPIQTATNLELACWTMLNHDGENIARKERERERRPAKKMRSTRKEIINIDCTAIQTELGCSSQSDRCAFFGGSCVPLECNRFSSNPSFCDNNTAGGCVHVDGTCTKFDCTILDGIACSRFPDNCEWIVGVEEGEGACEAIET
ncbi:unnamed protein product, partial [Durusdinium trenchii]